jgi:hypothetical protein
VLDALLRRGKAVHCHECRRNAVEAAHAIVKAGAVPHVVAATASFASVLLR